MLIHTSTSYTGTIHYTISRSPSSESVIHRRLDSAKKRQQFDYNLPTGVTFDQLHSYWEELGWGGGDQKGNKNGHEVGEERRTLNVDQGRFREADEWIELLRGISRKGLAREEARIEAEAEEEAEEEARPSVPRNE